MQIITYLAVNLLVGLVSLHSYAHEFWMEPSDFQPRVGDKVTVDLVIGDNFEGFSSPYTPDEIAAFGMIDAAGTKPIIGRFGDMPAGKFIAAEAGLLLLYHQTTPSYETYTKPEKFTSFAAAKGFADVVAHYKKPQPKNFRLVEKYSRFVKSLIMVGPASGQDQLLGLEMELVALKNPYQQPVSKEFSVAVYESGVPLPRAQVTVFIRHTPRDIEKKIIMADSQGRVHLALLPGRQYLFDSVKLKPIKDAGSRKNAQWESLWASLTFAVPDE
jgi:uncharacterized GH25 family protein